MPDLLRTVESDLAATTARVADAERRRQLLRDALTRLRLGEPEGVVRAGLEAKHITLAMEEE